MATEDGSPELTAKTPEPAEKTINTGDDDNSTSKVTHNIDDLKKVRLQTRRNVTLMFNRVLGGTYKKSPNLTREALDWWIATLGECYEHIPDKHHLRYMWMLRKMNQQLDADESNTVFDIYSKLNLNDDALVEDIGSDDESLGAPKKSFSTDVNTPTRAISAKDISPGLASQLAAAASPDGVPIISTLPTSTPPTGTFPFSSWLSTGPQSAGQNFPSVPSSAPQVAMMPIQLSYTHMQCEVSPYDGSAFTYGQFIKSFEMKFEADTTLTVFNRFLALKKLVGKEGSDLVNTLDLDAAGYAEAKERLQRHFANPFRIREEASKKLSAIPTITTERDHMRLMKAVETCETVYKALLDCGTDINCVNQFYYKDMAGKFPFSMVKRFLERNNYVPDAKKLLQYVRKEAMGNAFTAESMGLGMPSRTSVKVNATSSQPTERKPFRRTDAPCNLCENQGHRTVFCTVGDAAHRKSIATRKKLCFRCLDTGHSSPDCRSTYLCRNCNAPHSRAICTNNPGANNRSQQVLFQPANGAFQQRPSAAPFIPAGTSTGQPNSVNNAFQQRPSAASFSQAGTSNGQPNSANTFTVIPRSNGHSLGAQYATVIPRNDSTQESLIVSDKTTSYLQTVLVKINGVVMRILLDSGDSRTMIAEEVADRLNLKYYGPSNLKFVGAFNGTNVSERRVSATIEALDGSCSMEVVLNTVPALGPRKLSALSAFDHQILKERGYLLSDTTSEHVNQYPIQMILGVEYYNKIWTQLPIPVSAGLYVTRSIFGWVVSGIANQTSFTSQPYIGVITDQVVDDPPLPTEFCGALTEVEQNYVTNFMSNNITFENDRYTVRLPWLDPVNLPTNRKLAFRRFDLMIEHLEKEKLTKLYTTEMETLIATCAERAPPYCPPNRTCITPLQPVIRLDKETTQVRIVGDFSAHYAKQLSLNDNLFKGSNTWNSLELFLRFRLGAKAMVADIEKAFLNINVHPDDRDALRFLWYDHNGKIVEYRFTVVPFGTSASPFLLYSVMQHHFNRFEAEYPDIVPRLRKCFYVDDLMSASNPTDPFNLQHFKVKSEELLKKGGMNLRKFRANDPALDHDWAPGAKTVIKILGHQLDLVTDTLSLAVNVDRLLSQQIMSKRMFSSFVASIYDPTGIVTPYTVLLRLFQQKLCKANLGWDTELPSELISEASSLIQQVIYVNDAKVPRNVLPFDEPAHLRIYCDANPNVVGIVAYVQTQKSTHFYKAQATVAEKGSIPVLELKGITMAANCAKDLSTCYPFASITILSDSLPNLQRLNKHPNRMDPALSLQISNVKRIVPAVYRHVESKLNIADLITKGSMMTDLITNKDWWTGPPCSETTMCEVVVTAVSHENHDQCTTHSKYTRALGHYRVIAKWILKARLPRYIDLSTEQLALILMLKSTQRTHWAKEIALVQQNQPLPNDSILKSYMCIIDEHGLLRMRSRLEKSEHLTTDQKYPIFLPPYCSVSRRIIESEHARMYHAGVDRTMEAVRDRYFIFRLKNMAKQVRTSCHTCKLLLAVTPTAPYGALPAFRIDQTAAPFTNTGLDIFGPLKVNVNFKGKIYGLILTCATTRAIHLELLLNMTAEEVFSALRRFMGRRGIPHLIYSDNGSQLVAIRKRLLTFMNELQTLHPDREFRFSWQLQTAISPWRGGFYERLIRSVKSALTAITLRKKNVSPFELNTIFTEIEGRLNSRPLFTIDGEVKTPAHFFALKPLTQLPPIGNNDAKNITRTDIVDRYLKSQRCINAVYRAFQAKFILEVENYHKSNIAKHPNLVKFEVGDVVFLKNNTKADDWPTGIVQETCPTTDEFTRTVMVRTRDHGSYEDKPRAIQTLIPLECKFDGSRTSTPESA